MFRILTATLAALSLAACETQDGDMKTPAARPAQDTQTAGTADGTLVPEMQPITVTGALSYSQRIALPADAVAEITVSKAGLPEDDSGPAATKRFELNGRQVPIPFEIRLNENLSPQTRALRIAATISDASGRVLWENADDTVVDVQPGRIDLDIVRLVPTSAAVTGVDDISGRSWMVARLNGAPVLQTARITLNFSDQGRLSGEASCNAYTGSYSLKHGELSVAPLALTRKACVPQVMAQEETFISLLQNVSQVRMDARGDLRLETADGRTIHAR